VGVAVVRSSGAPVRERVDACLYRAATWSATIKARLFIHARNWKSIRLVTSGWICRQLAVFAGRIWLYRIYQEGGATDGDIRALCDLEGRGPCEALSA
jgi:hypothetical protein